MNETPAQFEERKKEHLRIALDPKHQALGMTGLESISLIPEAIPQINFDEVDTSLTLFGQRLSAPIFISSMTAGASSSFSINFALASSAAKHGWMMAVGSQRRELDEAYQNEWVAIRKMFPDLMIVGNIGITQAIAHDTSAIQNLIDRLQAKALFVHLNPLQECLQPEGTPLFRGSMAAIRRLAQELSVPVLLKEVGCGVSPATLDRLRGSGIYAFDVAGLGGTHWGRIESSRRADCNSTFNNWGLSTVTSLNEGIKLNLNYKLWASGGVRSGLDAAKLLAMGAEMVGVAQPFLQAALQSGDAIDQLISSLEKELRIAMFCTGCANLAELRRLGVWKWK